MGAAAATDLRQRCRAPQLRAVELAAQGATTAAALHVSVSSVLQELGETAMQQWESVCGCNTHSNAAIVPPIFSEPTGCPRAQAGLLLWFWAAVSLLDIVRVLISL